MLHHLNLATILFRSILMMPSETFPLLRDHLCCCTVIQVRDALLPLRPGLNVPKGNKRVLIDAVLQHAGESAIRHREVCDYVLKNMQTHILICGPGPIQNPKLKVIRPRL